ncbi:hypothetical protein ACOI1H_14820 [Loktanella sp. DJP18]|uniref:hypothetical protein n=1 Tax=Loktanella sp. DJP18 TaxID=3409788 RepID=UPI003BB5E7FB
MIVFLEKQNIFTTSLVVFAGGAFALSFFMPWTDMGAGPCGPASITRCISLVDESVLGIFVQAILLMSIVPMALAFLVYCATIGAGIYITAKALQGALMWRMMLAVGILPIMSVIAVAVIPGLFLGEPAIDSISSIWRSIASFRGPSSFFMGAIGFLIAGILVRWQANSSSSTPLIHNDVA